MVVCFVRLYPSLAPNALPSARACTRSFSRRRNIPSSEGPTWSELRVRRSGLSGLGVFPCHVAIWNDVAQLARAAAHLVRAAAHLARAAAPLARVHQHSTRGGAACATLAAAGTSQPVLHGEPIVNCGRHAAGPAQSVSLTCVPAQPDSGGRGQWWRSASRWLCVPRVSEGVSCEAAPGAAAPRDPSAATAIGPALWRP